VPGSFHGGERPWVFWIEQMIGVPEVVLISMKKFQGILETLDILSDEKAMASIRTSIRQAKKGMWIDFDKVFEE